MKDRARVALLTIDPFVYTLSYPYPADIVARLADEVVGAVQAK